MAAKRILIIEDDIDIQELVRYNLEKSGYRVDYALDGEAGLKKAGLLLPDLVLLDIMMPRLDGLEVCRRLKAEPRTASIPVMMMTARGEESDIVTGLDAGAQDYICKPFSPRVLAARVRACLRRAGGRDEGEPEMPVLHYRDLMIDPRVYQVKMPTKTVNLTATEFKLLYFLAEHPGWVYTRDQIIDAVRGDDYAVTDRSVDVQVVGLRRKLEAYGECIETMRGVGYRLREE